MEQEIPDKFEEKRTGPFQQDQYAYARAKKPEPSKLTLTGVIKDYGQSSSAHGIPHILGANNHLSCLLWTVVTVSAVALCCWQASKLINDYFEYPYATKIDLVNNGTLDFPAVTICNMNRMRRSQLIGTRFENLIRLDGGKDSGGGEDYSWWFDYLNNADYDQYGGSSQTPSNDDFTTQNPRHVSPSTDDVTDYAEFSVTSKHVTRSRSKRAALSDSISNPSLTSFDYPNWEGVQDENDWEGFLNSSVSDDLSDFKDIINPSKEELDAYGHQAESLILQCTFNKRYCNHTFFRKFQNMNYGNCFTFNVDGIERNTSKSGAQYGLHLTLFIEQPEYIGLFTHETGVRVAIHSKHRAPHPEDDGIDAPVGFATNIGIKQNTIRRLGKPHGNCANGLNSEYQSSVYQYSARSCTEHCLQTAMRRNCDCVTDFDIDYILCSYVNKTQQKCRAKVEKSYEDDELKCDCRSACEEISYTTSTSLSLWPSERYEEHLYRKLSAKSELAARILQDTKTSRKNLVRLRIYFEELNYQLSEQKAVYTVESLFGGVGGLVGLYIGFSMITFVEFGVLIVDITKLLFRKVFFPNQVEPSKE